MANLNDAQMKLVADLEIEMMADMYNRMTNACQKKCIPAKYRDPDLTKGEAVCIDRCVAKYLEIHDRIGKKLTSLSQQDEATMKKLQSQVQNQS
ncbi:mitochondrial import inner membrane translocase subunit Tim10-like [Haliotis rubra]|uniref:mitochondrial import inner membrane translocase subunit Tim10-like n=1 Tax=Haliotis rubra TaxID=36100 RepID=UPI001EE5FE07|nr:mitochondrial import inner membrane translocase subunit Tim10-like [Haliotis rubra]